MKAVVFVGPTLFPRDVSDVIDAECLPPVSQGDVYRAALEWPAAIGIIDGYFERVPSVWHKEILWAISQGIHVFGAASMGALRAAELASFGMTGVGKIFEAFRDGVLEDDDEVAVAHGSPEEGYRVCSDAMVNIRATLARAHADGIIGESTARLLERIAKRLFYPERSYAYITDLAASAVAPAEELRAFRCWLREGAVNQKRDDALAMLREMRDFLAANPDPKQVSWVLEETVFWDKLKRDSDQAGNARPRNDALVLEALRRDPAAWERASASALGWWLASERARRDGFAPHAAALLARSAEFCRAHGLSNDSDVARWLEENHCGRGELEQILRSLIMAGHARDLAPRAIDAFLLGYLRSTGDYPELLARARGS